MAISWRGFSYLDLHKTGCTFVREALLYSSAISPYFNRKHSRPIFNEPKVIMTCRSPVSLYLSLWRYGVDRKGGLYSYFASSFSPNFLDFVYQPDAINILTWLQLVESPFVLDHFFPITSKIFPCYTFFELRILKLALPWFDFWHLANRAHSKSLKSCFLSDLMSSTSILKTNSINNDICAMISALGVERIIDIAKLESFLDNHSSPINPSISSYPSRLPDQFCDQVNQANKLIYSLCS